MQTTQPDYIHWKTNGCRLRRAGQISSSAGTSTRTNNGRRYTVRVRVRLGMLSLQRSTSTKRKLVTRDETLAK
eukprot:scaffold10850_cov41-Prasinocladus_malaysianus.AAC.2